MFASEVIPKREGSPILGAIAGFVFGPLAVLVAWIARGAARTKKGIWLGFGLRLVVALIGAALSMTRGPNGGARAVDPRIEGDHCISADPLTFNFLREPHTTAEILAQKALVRRIEVTRIRIGHDGTVDVSGMDGEPHLGRVTGAERTDGGQSLTIAWEGTAPPPPVLAGARAVFEWRDDSLVLNSSDGRDQFYLVRPDHPMCVEADTAWLHDPAAPSRPPPTSVVAPEPWSAQQPALWPQLVLTNHATFRDSSALSGASSFLISSHGRVLLATALHLLGSAGGVEPPVALASFDRNLTAWSSFVRTRPAQAIAATSLAMRPVANAAAGDWLLLETAPLAAQDLPARPLALRESPVTLGERVFLVGCEYRDVPCTQGVISARVTARSGHSFRCELDRPTVLNGFSGAPIVDVAGRVVGVMSVWFSPFKLADGAYLEGGGQDSTVVLPLIVPPA